MSGTDSAPALTVAAVQLGSQDSVPDNLGACERWVARARQRGARVVLLPENFAYMGAETGKRALAERVGDTAAPIQRALSEIARGNQLTLIAGGFPETSGDADRPFNTCLVVGPTGETRATYRKIHLFDVSLPDGTEICESAASSAGRAPVVVEVDGWRLGLSICYDLRFPELYRALSDLGAEILLVPAAFTATTGKDHWHVLLRARAIEAQCFVVAAAQSGQHPKGRSTYGHSLIADPWGTVIAECSDGAGIAVAELDRSLLERVRRGLPSLSHRVL